MLVFDCCVMVDFLAAVADSKVPDTVVHVVDVEMVVEGMFPVAA